ncbi:MAG: sodium:proton antiporter [Planctomycetales bacterium]
MIPFALLLLAIAVLPLIPATEHWWESNSHRFYVAAGLGAVSLVYYLFFCTIPVHQHWIGHGQANPAQAGPNWFIVQTVLENALMAEYIPFIMLLFSLYTISGGIRIQGDLPAHPWTNTKFIAAGGLLASFIGTTGAAMLLIRPLLETNKERRHVRHTVVFFIFVVCNCGGCLLPIGDPPLFLGYLRGVPFTWTFKLFVPWLFVNTSLLVIYYLWDTFLSYPHETQKDVARDETEVARLEFSGWINVVWLLGVVVAVACLDPSKVIPIGGFDWRPPLYLREIVQLALVGTSLLTTPANLRLLNSFSYGAILEVAALFVGIFVCMQPALQILDVKGASMPLDSPTKFFWATGGLSSVLDNAPTYVVFFETAKSRPVKKPPTVAVNGGDIEESLLVAISLGAVFMGAMTYIGNGPNFMVKAIAEKSGVVMPSFFGYLAGSLMILAPLFLILNILLSVLNLW